MRGLVQRVRRTDPDAANSLAVISHFDDLNAQQASLADLLCAAAGVAACSVVAWDLLNARTIRTSSEGELTSPDEPAPVGHVLPSYGAVEINGDLVVSINTAFGSIGMIRLESIEKQWRDIDFMVAERLAASVAIEATKYQQQTLAESRMDPAALVQLVTAGLDEAQVQLALSRVPFPTDRNLIAIAVRSRKDTVGPQVAARLVVETLTEAHLTARSATIDALGLVIALDAPNLLEVINDYCASSAALGTSLSIGVGSAGHARLLPQSWVHAMQACALVTPHGDDDVVSAFNDLGALALISRLPSDEVEALPDIVQLRELQAVEPLDVQLLELYCETASMRTVAQYAHMHHSSVDYRLKRIGKLLGIDLGSSTGRLRALLAVKLLRVMQAKPAR